MLAGNNLPKALSNESSSGILTHRHTHMSAHTHTHTFPFTWVIENQLELAHQNHISLDWNKGPQISLYIMILPIKTWNHSTVTKADCEHSSYSPHEVSHKTWGKVIARSPPVWPFSLKVYNTINVWQHFFSWNVSLGLVDTESRGIQNGTRHSGFLIKCYRKAILSKVTCVALHQVTVMSILKPKQRQVKLVLILSPASITNTTGILVKKETK